MGKEAIITNQRITQEPIKQTVLQGSALLRLEEEILPSSLSGLTNLQMLLELSREKIQARMSTSMAAAADALCRRKIRQPSEIAKLGRAIRDLDILTTQMQQEAYSLVTRTTFPITESKILLPSEIEREAKLTFAILRSFDQIQQNPDLSDLYKAIGLSLVFNQRVELAIFACPVLRSEYLSMEGAETSLYISENANGSNLLTNRGTIKQLFRELYRFDIPAKLTVIVGDNDEDAYIFPVTGIPPDLNSNESNRRMALQAKDLEAKFRQDFPSTLEVRRWTKMAKGIRVADPSANLLLQTLMEMEVNPLTFFTEEDINSECVFMQKLFEKGGYYDFASGDRKIFQNFTGEMVRKIVVLKFVTYALQGAAISLDIPYSVLLQNERPPLFRTKMLNAINIVLQNLNYVPVIYLCV